MCLQLYFSFISTGCKLYFNYVSTLAVEASKVEKQSKRFDSRSWTCKRVSWVIKRKGTTMAKRTYNLDRGNKSLAKNPESKILHTNCFQGCILYSLLFGNRVHETFVVRFWHIDFGSRARWDQPLDLNPKFPENKTVCLAVPNFVVGLFTRFEN